MMKTRKRKRSSKEADKLTLDKGQEIIYAKIYQTCLCLPADLIALMSSYVPTLMIGDDVLFTDYDAKRRSITARFSVPMDAKSYFIRTREFKTKDLTPRVIRRSFPFFSQPVINWYKQSLRLCFENDKSWVHNGYTLFSPDDTEIRGFRCFFPRFSPHFHFLCDFCNSANVNMPTKTSFVNGVAFFLCVNCEDSQQDNEVSICHLCGSVSMTRNAYLPIGFREPQTKKRITVCPTCNRKLPQPLYWIDRRTRSEEHLQHNRSILLAAGALISGHFLF